MRQLNAITTTITRVTVSGITYCRCVGLTLASAARVSHSLSFVLPKESLLVTAGDFVGDPPCTSLLVAVGGLVVDSLCTSLLVAVGGLVGDPLCTRVVIVGGLVGESCCDGEETRAIVETYFALVGVGSVDCCDGGPFGKGHQAIEVEWIISSVKCNKANQFFAIVCRASSFIHHHSEPTNLCL